MAFNIHHVDDQRDRNSPAPVTRATFPSNEAEASPRGPGIWSYLLLEGVLEVATVMVSGFLNISVEGFVVTGVLKGTVREEEEEDGWACGCRS